LINFSEKIPDLNKRVPVISKKHMSWNRKNKNNRQKMRMNNNKNNRRKMRKNQILIAAMRGSRNINHLKGILQRKKLLNIIQKTIAG
jgi:hypothetical protein